MTNSHSGGSHQTLFLSLSQEGAAGSQAPGGRGSHGERDWERRLGDAETDPADVTTFPSLCLKGFFEGQPGAY